MHGGTRWRSLLSHWATSRKVAVSIPDGAIGIFHWHNPSGRTMALGLAQPLTEMSTRNISCGVKAAGAYGWQPYHLHVSSVMESGSLNLMEPSGTVQGLLHFFYITYTHINTCTHARAHTHAHTHTHTHTYTQTFAAHRITDNAAIIVGVCVRMYVCMYTFTRNMYV